VGDLVAAEGQGAEVGSIAQTAPRFRPRV